MRSAPFIFAGVVLSLGLAACGGGGAGGRGTTPEPVRLPTVTDDASYTAAVRTYHGLDLDQPGRIRFRERIVAYLVRQGAADVETDDYDAVVARVAEVTDLFTPEDFAERRIPRELGPLARWLVERGSPRGDEARVLAGLRILRAIETDEDAAEAHEREYERLAGWGRDARQNLGSPFEGYDGLIGVWEEQARLSPAPEILRTLARLYLERRDSIAEMFRSERQLFRPELMNAPMMVQRAPLDVAAVWLRHGDVATSLTHVEAMGDSGAIEARVIQLLRDARDGGGDAAEALIELAETYARIGRAEIALALGRLGHRRDREDARFPLLLARLAAAGDRPDDATAWYAETIRLEPDERQLYDEAIEQLAELIGTQGDDDPARARAMVRQTESILEERMRRFPDTEASVSVDRFHQIIGMLEMSAGNAEQAERRFRASLEARENADALLQLGILAERTGRAQEALRHYRRALDLTPGQGPGDGEQRASILEHLGDAYREAGDSRQAERMYRQALEALDAAADVEGVEPAELATIHVRRGVVRDRLGMRAESVGAFQEAMGAAPDRSETYAQILAHLVVGTPDLELAHEVFRRAQRQLTLEPEWKVYFALWVQVIAGRARAQVDGDVRSVLEELSGTETWWAMLAKFGTGALAYQELLGSAADLGEQTEAHFYEGARLFVTGNVTAAQDLFRRVLATQMVSFFEFAMAQELLASTPAATAAPPAPSAPQIAE